MEQNKKNEYLNYLIPLLQSFIENDFSFEERREMIKILKYLKTNLYDLFSNIYDGMDKDNISANITSKSLSYSYKNSDESIRIKKLIYKDAVDNKILDKNLAILLYRLDILFQTHFNNDIANNLAQKEKEIIAQLDTKTFILGQRYGLNTQIITEVKSRKTFRANLNFKNCSTSVYKDLTRDFLKNTEINNFKMAFSIEKMTKNFKKVNWEKSIFELKSFIKLLMDNKFIVKEENYYEIIEDCFTVNSKDIVSSQLENPKGSKKRLEILESVISKKVALQNKK